MLGRQGCYCRGVALEPIPGLGVPPFWLLVVGAIAVPTQRSAPRLGLRFAVGLPDTAVRLSFG